jgi:AraC family transcriptional regulator, transcriptional activator of the genes for pyochelin and ferripyochelin receptors
MTISISQQAYWELFDEVDQTRQTWQYPQQLGQGYYQEIELREGLWLAIANYQLHDCMILKSPERGHILEYSFYLCGHLSWESGMAVGAGEYFLCGSGMAPQETLYESAKQPLLEVNVHITPELFCSYVGELPKPLQPLLRKSDREYYIRSGTTTTSMQIALQQILQCPYNGLVKRMYLESKVWELLSLLLEPIQEESQKPTHYSQLNSKDIDRIHHAREILLRNLDNPPSLLELARQVGLNDCTLKRGFRQVFGTTAFGYLHDYRLEQARQLLKTGEMNIAEVSRAVGFTSRSYFAAAFRKQFGLNPKDYQIKRKYSL